MSYGRVLRTLSVSALVFLSIGSQVALSATDTATLQLGAYSVSGCGWLVLGYNDTLSFGSYSPTGLTGGETVTALSDINSFAGCPSTAILAVSGFASNPGVDWLTSVTCNGVTNPVSSATFEYLGGGQAQWQWSQIFGFFGLILAKESNTTCTIVHN